MIRFLVLAGAGSALAGLDVFAKGYGYRRLERPVALRRAAATAIVVFALALAWRIEQ
jgi:hypothetical protein